MDSSAKSDIKKPENDLKEYHFIELKNKIQAFLISNTKHLQHFKLDSHSSKKEEHHTQEDDDNENFEDEIEDEEYEDEGEDSGEMDLENEGHDEEDSKGKHKKCRDKAGLATVAITVGIGSCSDPEEIQGLAHLLEHVIFLGSKTFPEPDYFSKFISRHGGYENAYTSLNATTYEFEVSNEKLGEALHIFSRLLKEPLLGSEGIKKEVQAIDNEFELAIVDEDIQRFQIISNSFHKGFPLRTFSWGNSASLDKDDQTLQNGIRTFYEKYYSPEKIKICILANYKIEELIQMVFFNFSDLQMRKEPCSEREISKDEVAQAQFDLAGCFFTKTPSQIQKLTMTFAVESLQYEIDTYPLDIILDILSEKGPGSLFDYLKNRNLITDLSAEIRNVDGQENEHIYLPWLSMKLTDHGVENIEAVIQATGEYLNMVNKEEIPDYYWNESVLMSELEFKYADEISEDQLTNIISNAMKYVPKEKMIESAIFRVPKKQDAELIKRVLKCFNIFKCRIDIQMPEINENLKKYKVYADPEYEHFEPYFKIPFTSLSLQKILGNNYQMILKGDYQISFTYPPKNPLIPEKLSIDELEDPFDIPTPISAQNQIQVWYSIDNCYKIPKVNINILMIFNIKKSSAMNAYFELLEVYLRDEFNKGIGNQARKAGFGVTFNKHEYYGIEIGVYGFSEKMVLLCNMMVEFLYEKLSNISEETFNLEKEKKKKYYEKLIDDPEAYLKICMMRVLFDFGWLPEQKRDFYDKKCLITEFRKLCSELCDIKALREIKVQSHGNMPLKELKQLSEKIQLELSNFTKKLAVDNPEFLLSENEMPKGGLRILSETSTPVRATLVSHIKNTKTHMAAFFIRLAEDTLENRVSCMLLNQIFNTEIFEDLRMKQEIGYISNSYSITFPNLLIGIEIWVSSNKLVPDAIMGKVDEFIARFLGDFLNNYSEQEFQDLKKGEVASRMKPFQNIQEAGDYYWTEIKYRLYLMDRRQKEIEYIQNLEYKQFLDWIKSCFKRKEYFSLGLEVLGIEDESYYAMNSQKVESIINKFPNIKEYYL